MPEMIKLFDGADPELVAAGPEGHYQEELWLASALLGLTFPVLVVVTDYFDFWPLKK